VQALRSLFNGLPLDPPPTVTVLVKSLQAMARSPGLSGHIKRRILSFQRLELLR
jgi:hypothetical protein